MYNLVFGFDLQIYESDYEDANPRILGEIPIDAKEREAARVEADQKLSEYAKTSDDNATNTWLPFYIRRFRPWQLRHDKYGCALDGLVRNSKYGFQAVLKPRDEVLDAS